MRQQGLDSFDTIGLWQLSKHPPQIRIGQGSRPFALAVSISEYRLALAFTTLTEWLKSQFLRLWKAFHNRRNWLFSDTPRGARASATCYSLIETAKANGLEPYAYLHHVLQHIAAADTLEKIEALLPWNMK